MRATSGFYNARLDHIRFLAVMMVVFWHYRGELHAVLPQTYAPGFPLLSLFDEGHTGVGLFLCLSGFIFAALCHDRAVRYGDFIRNRLLRIAPLGLFWVAVYFFSAPETGSTAELAASLLTLFNRGAVPDVGWSVIVEAQFYVIFPFLLIFSRRYGLRFLIGLVIVFLCVRCAIFLAKGSVQLFAYSTIFGRFDQIAAGMIAGFLSKSHATQIRRLAWPLCVAGLLVATAAVHAFNLAGGFMNFGGVPFPSKSPAWLIQLTLEGIGYSLMILGYCALPGGNAGRAGRLAAYIGAISYSIYWSHKTVFHALNNTPAIRGFIVTAQDMVLLFPIYLTPVVLFSMLTYHLIEKPFFDLRKLYWPPDAPALPTPAWQGYEPPPER
jgi:peptidoglycan/LPS O-acetylase OafA/YrhL